MFNLPNILSLARIPLAFAFLNESMTVRAVVVILALLSDGLDGYVARKYRQVTRLGTALDPLTDRFFVIFALIVLYTEDHIKAWQIFTMFSRDFAIFIFGAYLALRGTLHEYYLRAIWCGKITTVLQLIVLFSLTLGAAIPVQIWYLFIALGGFAFIELYYSDPKEHTIL